MSRYIVILLMLIATGSAMGQLDSLLLKSHSLEDLMNMKVVSASRTNMKISQAPANIIVITSNQIEERGYRTLEEVMKDLPGFDFATGQPAGEYPAHFSFRGIGDVGQTKFVILVDGIVQNDISNGWVRNVGFNFTMTDVDRIEFVSGPGSSLFGANSYAGFINVITKNPNNEKLKNVTEVRASVGSYGTTYPELYSRYKFKSGLSVQVSGRYYRSVGDGGLNRPDPGNYFHNNFEPDSVLTTEHGNIINDSIASGNKPVADGFNTGADDYYIRTTIGKEGFKAGFNYWGRKEGLGSEVPGYEYFANTPGIDYLAHHRGSSLFMQYMTDLGNKTKSMSRVYYRNTSILPRTGFVYTYKYQSVDNGIDTAVVDKKKGYSGEGYVVGIEQQVTVDFSERHNLVFGFQGEQKIREYFGISLGEEQDVNSTIVSSTYASEVPSVQPVYFSKYGALFAQGNLDVPRLFRLTGGVRYDVDEFYGDVLNPKFAIVRAPRKGFNAKLLFGTAFKAPTIFELQDEWRGNKELIPERISTYEAEVGYLMPELGSFKLNIFRNELRNLISVAPNPDPLARPIGPSGQFATYYQNTGRTAISGVTLRSDIFLYEKLWINGNYQFLIAGDGTELDNISKHKLNLGMTYSLNDKVNFNLRANWVSKVKAPATNRYFHTKDAATIQEVGYDYVTEANPDGYLEGFTVLNLTVTGKNLLPNKKVSLEPQLIVRNLLDTDYVQMGRQSGSGTRPVDGLQPSIQNPSGFIPAYHPQPGREIFVSLKIGF